MHIAHRIAEGIDAIGKVHLCQLGEGIGVAHDSEARGGHGQLVGEVCGTGRVNHRATKPAQVYVGALEGMGPTARQRDGLLLEHKRLGVWNRPGTGSRPPGPP